MATPGGVENARKFRDGEISAQEYHRVVNEDLKQDAAASMLYSWYGSQGGGLVFTVAGGATSGPAGAAAGEPVGNAIGGATGALAGFVYSRATKAIVRAADSCFKGSGNGGGNKQRLEKVQPRKVDTQTDQLRCWEKLKESGEWRPVKGYKKPTLQNTKTERFLQKSREKWEIGVFDKNESHIGVIKPSDGKFHPELAVKGRKMRK